MKEILLYFSLKYYGNWDEIYKALESKEYVSKEEVKSRISLFKGNFITILDENYPKSLKEISKPPFVLFYKGNLSLLKDDKNIIWPFGSYVTKIVEETSWEVTKQNIKEVIGYTDIFEKSYLNENTKSKYIIVKDSGIDCNLILEDKTQDKLINNKNLIISEYPGFVMPTKRTWLESNKIKIGLSKGIFLINTIKDSELFSLIAKVIEEGKDVFCYSKKDENKNNHNSILIEKGALEIKKVIQLKK